MKILVIGGAGYIGSHTVMELCDLDNEVVVFDNFSTGFAENIDKRATIEEGDILNENDLNNLFSKYNFSFVFHFCALKSADESMDNPIRYSRNNLIGGINIINQMLTHKVYNIIFSSSAAVYGKSVYLPMDEKHPLDPLNFYGFTKLEFENILRWYSKISSIKYVSLRYFNAAGYDEKRRIKIPEKNPQNLLPKIMEVVVGERKNLEIYGANYDTKDGTCVRDYIHVTDLAKAHIQSIKYIQNGGRSNVFNLASGVGYSVLEVVKTVEKLIGRKLPVVFKDRRLGDPEKVIASTMHKDNPLDWESRHSDIENIIQTLLQIYCDPNSSNNKI